MPEISAEVKEILKKIQENNEKRVKLYDEWQELKTQLEQLQETIEPNDPPKQEIGQKTCGNFANEIAAENFFDNKLKDNPYFTNEKQVRGRRLIDFKPILNGSDKQHLKIDSILHPTPLAIKAGWKTVITKH